MITHRSSRGPERPGARDHADGNVAGLQRDGVKKATRRLVAVPAKIHAVDAAGHHGHGEGTERQGVGAVVVVVGAV